MRVPQLVDILDKGLDKECGISRCAPAAAPGAGRAILLVPVWDGDRAGAVAGFDIQGP
jgi:hypothetical protein